MRTIVGHHIGSDLASLVRAGYALPQGVRYFDTLAGAQWLWPDHDDLSLESLILRVDNMAMWRTTLGKLSFEDFDRMPDGELFARCAGDAEATRRLAPIVAKELQDLRMNTIWGLAMDVLPILAEMGGRGMALNRPVLHTRALDAKTRVHHAKAELQRLLGVENIDSHDQLEKILYGPLWQGAPLKNTQTGYSTDRMSLLWVRHQAREQKQERLEALADALLEYGEVRKLYTTYYGDPDDTDPKAPPGWIRSPHVDQAVHSVYSVGRASTGRLASAEVNLQNVPEEIQDVIVPHPGYDLIVSADYSALEYVIGAHNSQDPTMLSAAREGKDPHAMMAAVVMGLPMPESKADFARFKEQYGSERDIGKMTNFSTIYGITAESLPWKIFNDTKGKLLISEADAQAYIDAFYTLNAGYKAWGDRLFQELKTGNWIVSATGRRWLLPATRAGHRKALNYPTQSLASDLTLMALRTLYSTLTTQGWRSRLIGEVHDSLVLETTQAELPALCRLLRQICENPDTRTFGFQLTVPLRIEIQTGPTWGTLTPYLA